MHDLSHYLKVPTCPRRRPFMLLQKQVQNESILSCTHPCMIFHTMWRSQHTPHLTNSKPCQECWYFVKQAQKITREDETGDTLRMKARADVDPTLRAALLDSDTGLMRAGALPKVSTANAAGAKAVLEGTEKASPCLVHMFPIENRPSNESIFSHASYKVVEIWICESWFTCFLLKIVRGMNLDFFPCISQSCGNLNWWILVHMFDFSHASHKVVEIWIGESWFMFSLENRPWNEPTVFYAVMPKKWCVSMYIE